MLASFHVRVTVTFDWTLLSHLRRPSLNLALQCAPPWQDGAFGVDGLPTSLVGSNWLSELAALRRAQKANWIPREVPATNRPPGAPPLRLCGDVSAGSSAKPARERGLSLDPYRSRTPVRCFVAPCLMPFDAKIRTPHPISEFSSATDKSASSPGCSISAAPIDLAAARTCSPRMAPRYREAFVTVSSRRSFSVSELHLKDFDRCGALT